MSDSRRSRPRTETPAARLRRRLRGLGAALSTAQAAAGLSAEQLGASAGLSARQVRRARRGANLSIGSLFQLCDALDLDLRLLGRRPGPGELLEVTRAAVECLERAVGKLHPAERRAVRLLPAILGRLSPEERRALLGF